MCLRRPQGVTATPLTFLCTCVGLSVCKLHVSVKTCTAGGVPGSYKTAETQTIASLFYCQAVHRHLGCCWPFAGPIAPNAFSCAIVSFEPSMPLQYHHACIMLMCGCNALHTTGFTIDTLTAPSRPLVSHHCSLTWQVWALAVHVTVLDHDGALADACLLATMAALMAHRRPDATVDPSTSKVTVHSVDVREPVPLSLHHYPLAVSFALFKVRQLCQVCAGILGSMHGICQEGVLHQIV